MRMSWLDHSGSQCKSHGVNLQGVVAFVPAFAHCDQLFSRWQQTGLLVQLAAKKTIFKEPRAANEVEAMLQQYAECITQSRGTAGTACNASTASSLAGTAAVTGGLMLCVVGGKLSEGINFSDGFGRSACSALPQQPVLEMIDNNSNNCSCYCMAVLVFVLAGI